MTDKIIRASDVENANAWVMPEMGGNHIVRSNRDNRAGGYKRIGRKVAATPVPRALTAEKIEALKKQAEEQGFEQGREAGYQQGYSEAQAAGREILDEYKSRMEQLLDTLASAVETQLELDREALQSAVAELVVCVSEQVCMQHIARSDAMVDIVRTALSGLPATEKAATLSVNPEDFKLLEGVPEFSASYLTLRTDETLSRGSCYVQSEHSDIKFLLDERIKDSVQKHFSVTDADSS